LKQQEKDFRACCAKERKRLQELLSSDQVSPEDEEELQKIEMIEQTYRDDQERLASLRSLCAKKTRDIVMIKRRIDEIPSRTELTQYQQALLDLYEQIDAKLSETRQYFSTYNTLTNTLEFWQSEVNLMESITANYKIAMKNEKTREAFLKQLQQKLDMVAENIVKANEKLGGEKGVLDVVKKKYGLLLEKERSYFKATKEFQEECALNEKLTAQSG
jgi:outer membrane protein TolC